LLNKSIPPALEIIVGKAMAKSPADRYASAQELADDLRRFVEDKPIRARRPSWLEQARRWARRHQPVVLSAATACLATLAVLAGCSGWVVRDQAAQQAKRTSDLREALDKAQRAKAEGKWPQAQAAARRAEALLDDGAAEPAVVHRVRALLQELADEDADRQIVVRLEALRLRQAETNIKENRFSVADALPDYRRAFRDYGMEAQTLAPAAVAARLQHRPPAVRNPVLAALDHWLILARFERAPEVGWLEQVLAVADTDPWRQRVRAARLRNDRSALEQLAREVNIVVQPPEALFVLEVGLRQRGAYAAAVTFLRRAQEAYPDDFWINHDLGIALQHGQPAQYGEAIRFLTVAAALRPRNPGVRVNLGMALEREGRMDEAVAVLRQAIGLQPDYLTAHQQLGRALLTDGRPDEAVVAFRRVRELKPDFFPAHHFLGVSLARLRRFDEAAVALREAIRLKPDFALAHCHFGEVLRAQGAFASALASFQRGHELASQYPNWQYPSARHQKNCQRLLEMERQLPAILAGKVQPASVAEQIAFAQLCYLKKHYAAAARFWVVALAKDPSLGDDRTSNHHYHAACAAALAGCGLGADADSLSEPARAGSRQQALDLLTKDLVRERRLLANAHPKDIPLLRQRLRSWLCDHDLAEVRDAAALSRLPSREAQAWRQFWVNVAELLARTEAAS
jgi:serine/threonine-protein kinase